MNSLRFWSHSLSSFCFILVSTVQADAQIIPDSTLGAESSIVNSINGTPNTRLTGGVTRGSNLFHSFLEFSINNGQGAYFDTSNNIQTIITRVTGNKTSLINGALGNLGNADLFFLNPNGIIFGRNASLDLNGSFIGSTANNLWFKDKSIFPANPSLKSLVLTSSTPSSLEFSENPGLIQIVGEGNRLADFTIFPLFNPFNVPAGLSLKPNNTLALIGGRILSQGGVIRSSSGRIELGSISSGEIELNKINSGWAFDYSNVNLFQNIELTERSLIDTSGIVGGSINLQGRSITLDGGSTVLIQNLGDLPSGNITVSASESLTVSGISDDPRFITPVIAAIAGDDLNIKIPSTFLTETIGQGESGDIKVSTSKLVVNDGAQILTRTYSTGETGKIDIKATETIQVLDFAPTLPVVFSNISTATFNSGDSGDLTLSAKNIVASNGGSIGSATFNIGNGGDVNINATDITLTGVVPFLFIPSGITGATFSSGSAGTITINTSSLSLIDGGRLGTSTVASGDAGEVTINAAQFVKVSGTVPGSINPSIIDSSANIIDPALRVELGLPGSPLPIIPSGTAGDVSISTQNLLVDNGGLISVRNDGQGDAGSLTIDSKRISLNNGAIVASTNGGNGGNIDLLSELLISNNGLISGSAQGDGTGGNLTINSDLIVSFNNSLFSANAEQATGGNILVNTQGIFLGEDSKITASSLLGAQFTGNIEVNSPNIDFTKATLDLAIRPEIERVTTSCNISPGEAASEFTRPGSGGIASNSDSFGEISVATTSQANLQAQQEYYLDPETGKPEKYPNVVGWKNNPDGTIAFTSDPTEAVQTKAFCSKAASKES
ncbi:filamentous hemagglutinin N-terminal domain-containing protein [Acaryochloris marina]|uniref:two-partner secretion domain-containing protein n=1 Tax=Acaryochloris marina TaxID=155978 RepID=UPI001BAFD0A3|nr:filamentous hemagglutinin N-terminal domain-containing protein [Acaryochloris marina]QUY45717.1 filamentous hemagglutinin N-terminal domain-containing protein [Acaryochloris marina S15]